MHSAKIKKYINLILCIAAVAVCVAVIAQYIFAWFSNNKQTQASGMSFNISEGQKSSNIKSIQVNGKDISGDYYILPGEYYYFEIEPNDTSLTTLTVVISDIVYPTESNVVDDKIFDGMMDEAYLKAACENGTLPACAKALKFKQVDKKKNKTNSSLWEEAGKDTSFTYNDGDGNWQLTLTYDLNNGVICAMLYFDGTVDWVTCLEGYDSTSTAYGDRSELANSNGFYYQKFNISFALS